MSQKINSYKWFSAYRSTRIDWDNKTSQTITYIFDTHDEALNHAVENGEFDEICSKDSFITHEENLIFEVREDELKDYSPVKKVDMKIKKVIGGELWL